MQSAPVQVDAIVIGGGPAGCAASVGLARAGARVALCERALQPAFKPGEIVEPAIRLPLAELGLLDSFEALGSLMLAGSLSLWDSEVPVEVSGITNAHGHGALIDRQKFEQWLMCSAHAAGTAVFRGVSGLVAELVGHKWTVSWGNYEQRRAVSAPLLIEATGRGMGVVGHGRRCAKDRLVALLTYGSIAAATHDQRLMIEAAEHGWWYAASLPDHLTVVSFMTDVDLIPRAVAERSAYVNEQLANTKFIRHRAERLLTRRRLIGFPASSSLRQVINGPNWVAIGDAAATYDPLSGHGVSAALAKGVAIARLLTNCGNQSDALAAYADAERSTFADYLIDQAKTYARAARIFSSAFWSRRSTIPY